MCIKKLDEFRKENKKGKYTIVYYNIKRDVIWTWEKKNIDFKTAHEKFLKEKFEHRECNGMLEMSWEDYVIFQEDLNREKKHNHYSVGGIEVLDVIKAKMTHEEFIGFLKGNIIKYLLRMDHRGDKQGDFKKMKSYISMLAEFVYEL